jgi:hypothetical protein
MTLACTLLGASGGVRAWQDHRFATVENYTEVSPFPLKDLPQTVGDWQAVEGSETSLEPEIARIAGSSDHMIRTYTNTTTGQSISVLVLFGPAKVVFSHRPEICYPQNGYDSVAETLSRTISGGTGPGAEFFSQVYAKRGDPRRRRQEVYSSFRHADRWSPDPERFWKNFRHNPSMFKVQIQRLVGESERRELNNPTEQFLALLVPEIERQIAQARKTPEG